jgi:hypothetical protein
MSRPGALVGVGFMPTRGRGKPLPYAKEDEIRILMRL